MLSRGSVIGSDEGMRAALSSGLRSRVLKKVRVPGGVLREACCGQYGCSRKRNG